MDMDPGKMIEISRHLHITMAKNLFELLQQALNYSDSTWIVAHEDADVEDFVQCAEHSGYIVLDGYNQSKTEFLQSLRDWHAPIDVVVMPENNAAFLIPTTIRLLNGRDSVIIVARYRCPQNLADVRHLEQSNGII